MWIIEFETCSSEVYSIQHYVTKFASELRQVGGFLRFPPNNIYRHDIAEILLKVSLNTITYYPNHLCVNNNDGQNNPLLPH